MQYIKKTNDVVLALGLTEERALEIEDAVGESIAELKAQEDLGEWSFDLVAAGAAHEINTPEEAYYFAFVIFMLQQETQNIISSIEKTIIHNN